MRRALRWCTLAGITAGLLALTAQAFAATGWTVVTLPAGAAGTLTGSYALSDTDAWAVGYNGNTSTGPEAPVALYWNGTAWSTVSTPAPSGSTPDWGFYSVAASSTSDAWAVGEQSAGTKIHDSLYEHWNGTAWSVVSGPNEGKLFAVLDFSTTNAWAFAGLSTLHWNGTAWSVVSGVNGFGLVVSADSPTDIWGVSRDDMVSHYNGTSYSYTTLSNASEGGFSSVVALSPTDVWIAGTNGTGPLLEHFNGTSWQVMTTPSSFAGQGVIAMTAQSDSDVWIFSEGNPLTDPLLLANWNGSSWTNAASPIPADTLVSVWAAASSPTYTWVVGTNGAEPMILKYTS